MLIAEGDINNSIRGPVFMRIISDFKTICFKKNQKISRPNSKQKLQYMVNRTRGSVG